VSRTVTLLLVDATGRVFGALPPFDVPVPWWQDATSVVDGARERYQVDVALLRLLAAERPAPPGGAVMYLAEVPAAPPTPLGRVTISLSPHPLRAPYAEPGGPAASVSWARAALRALGRGEHTAAQQRTWNLSAIWRLDAAPSPASPTSPSSPTGANGHARIAWLKQVPWFFAHEAAVLRWLGAERPGVAPALLDADQAGRMLLDDVPGEDRYGADSAARERMLVELHAVQVRAVDAADALVALGLPDRRGDRLSARVRDVVERHGQGIDGLPALVDGLAYRLSAVDSCGLPDTLVHGDFHPGNVRADGDGRPCILDWGDSFVGNPAFDALRMTEDLPDAEPLIEGWQRRWRAAVPGCEPGRALTLLRPVAALLGAATYADFVDRIEPAERSYHAADVKTALREAVAAA
jgi:hypothetical protein